MTLRGGGGGGQKVNVIMTLIFPQGLWTSPLIELGIDTFCNENCTMILLMDLPSLADTLNASFYNIPYSRKFSHGAKFCGFRR